MKMTIQHFKTIAVPLTVLIIAIFTGIIVALIKYPPQKNEPLTFQILRAKPTSDLEVTTIPTIEISINGNLNPENTKLETSPAALFSSGVLLNNTISFKPLSNLDPNTTYNASFYYNNKLVTNWEFKTGNINPNINNQEIIDKIKKELPYKETAFTIDYVSKTDRFFVYLDLEPLEETQNKAKSWFIERGLVDPETKINIVWFPRVAPRNSVQP